MATTTAASRHQTRHACGLLAGPHGGSPAGHRVGRRWKKPQSSTTHRTPEGDGERQRLGAGYVGCRDHELTSSRLR